MSNYPSTPPNKIIDSRTNKMVGLVDEFGREVLFSSIQTQQPLSRTGFRYAGDSTMSQNDATVAVAALGSTASLSRYSKMMMWLWSMTMGGFSYKTMLSPVTNKRMGCNSGVGGSDFAEIIAKLPSLLAIMPEKYIFIKSGTNDINAGTPLATLKLQVASIVHMCLSVGVQPIFCTVLQRDSTQVIWSNTAGGTTTAQKKLALGAFNTWLREYCDSVNVICIPLHRLAVTAAGDLNTGMTSDGLHENARMGYIEAKEVMRVLGNILPRGFAGQADPNDVYDATYNPTGNILNTAFTSSASTYSDAGGGTALSGPVPTGWRLNKKASSAITAVSSIEDAADGVGKVWRVVFTNPSVGSGIKTFQLEYYSASSVNLTGWYNAGDYVEMTALISSSAHTGLLCAHGPYVSNSNGVTVSAATNITIDAAARTIVSASSAFSGFAAAAMPCWIVVEGAVNQGTYKIISATNSTLTLDPNEPANAAIVDMAAGTATTVKILAVASASNSSAEKWPLEAVPEYLYACPGFKSPLGGNIVPRINVYLDAAFAESVTIEVRMITLRKPSIIPAVLSVEANDN